MSEGGLLLTLQRSACIHAAGLDIQVECSAGALARTPEDVCAGRNPALVGGARAPHLPDSPARGTRTGLAVTTGPIPRTRVLVLGEQAVLDAYDTISAGGEAVVVGDHHERDPGLLVDLAHQLEDLRG